jgi:hypothetical protein
MALPTILLASTATAAGAINAATSSAVHIPGQPRSIAFVLDLTAAATDAGDTLDVKVQTRLDGTNWVDVVAFTQCLGNGGAKRHFAKIDAGIAQALFENGSALAAGSVRNLIGEVWRVVHTQVDADSDGSFTFSVTACPM